MIYNRITGTQPVHVHANGNLQVLGWAHSFFQSVLDLQRTGRAKFRECRLEVALYSDRDPGSTPIECSCRYWGVSPVRLSPPRLPDQPWQYIWKTQMAIEHLRQTRASWVLFTDADDTLLVRHPQDILLLLDGPALVSAERNSWPGDCPVPPYEGRYPYGNAGGIVGRVDWLLKLFERALGQRSKQLLSCDQYGVRMAAKQLGIPIDHQASIFQCLAVTEPQEVSLL